MTYYVIRIKYDGTDFKGYQKQNTGRTISEEVLKALKKTFGNVEKVTGCSRTDSGVHALDYCISFCSEKYLDNNTVIKALNAWLPNDISAFDCRNSDCCFNARHCVIYKEYMYVINNSQIRDPFFSRYSILLTHYLDINKLNNAASFIVGTHDFTSFMSSGSNICNNTVRTVKYAYFKKENGIVRFFIAADGFLYNMVRIIVGTLIDMSLGKIPYDKMPDIINCKDRSKAGHTAPPKALFLNKVVYDV